MSSTKILASPVSGTPKAPSETIQNLVNLLWGYVGWIVAVLGCFGLAACAVMAWSNHRQGQSNEGVSRAGWVLGGVMAIGMIGGLIGTITGT